MMRLFCDILSDQWLGSTVFEGNKTYQDYSGYNEKQICNKKLFQYCTLLKRTYKHGGSGAKWFTVLVLQSGGPRSKTSTLPLARFVSWWS